MGNQNGTYQYYNHLQAAQINNQAYPNSNNGNLPMFTLTQSAVLQNYPHQSNIPSQWPSGSHLPEQQYQQYYNNGNLHYLNNINLQMNQQNQRLSQLNNNIHKTELSAHMNYNNTQNSNNIINNQQRLSNISQQNTLSNVTQLLNNGSGLQQSQSLLNNNNTLHSNVTSDLVSNYQLGLNNTNQNSIIIPSILLNPVSQSYNSMLKINKSPNQLIPIPTTNEIPTSLRLQKINLKLAKDKFDVLANDYEYHLFAILEQIQLESNKGISDNNRLIYLLSTKRKFQKNIIEIRMKQQKLAKILSQFNTITDPNSIQVLLQSSNNSLMEMSYNNISQWKQIANSQNHPQFNHVVTQGKTHPQIMFSYNQKMKNYQKNIVTSQSSIGSINNNLLIHEGLSNTMKSKKSMASSMQNSLHMQKTAAFPNVYSSKVQHQSNLQSSKYQGSNLNQSSVSLPQNNLFEQQFSPFMYDTFSNISSSNIPTIISKEPIKQQVPKIVNFLQSRAVKPPQHQAFIPLLPTVDSSQN